MEEGRLSMEKCDCLNLCGKKLGCSSTPCESLSLWSGVVVVGELHFSFSWSHV